MKNTELYKKIGQKLQEARKKAGLTQEQVADYLGVNKTLISYYENGIREISIATLRNLSNLYGYTMSYFLSDDEINEPTISFSFRADELKKEDLEVIAMANEFLINLEEMKQMLAQEKEVIKN
ncbi:transcriptional regulator, XRE family [Caldicellulosiruptor saccharolyticus DSM 8903]|uniref:Transcriptional regulator, XRE family n=1 Tax=Caldicellulosiruptor saccharolyticus (strain ATCC 43494 / DSM 8903 / Tp8T 6331) TaxID=351627 RepID=A4XMS8_CALS8|nr:helix-turn-helix transcriptional regulator [Caldicellulosiruptor saccharolyticus]ABP68213.1 transcriptional regulator, XRE family [Caldicellulosiruptor saccharolyticus DSM 8903]